MNGSEKIIARIRQDADAERERILREADGTCAGIREEYEKKARALKAERLENGLKNLEAEADSRIRVGEMERKKERLALKQRMVRGVFGLVKKDLEELPEEEYLTFLTELCKKSARGGETVILNARDKAQYGGRLLAALKEQGLELSLSEEEAPFSGGLLLRKGNIEVNSSLDLLLELAHEELAAEVARILFAE